MAYSDLLGKDSQRVGYMFRIHGVQYYFVSHEDVPTLTDSQGGTAYTRVEGCFEEAPNSLPQQVHPFNSPVGLSTEVYLLDVSGVLTELLATERSDKFVTLAEDFSSSDTTGLTVNELSDSQGFDSFPSSGFIYVDGETIQYSSKSSGVFSTLVRNKFAEGFDTSAVSHDQYLLKGSLMPRPAFGYVSNLWYRECRLDVYDLDDTSNTATIARGFILEPTWEAEDVVRFRIENYIHAIDKQVFKQAECRGELSDGIVPLFIPQMFPPTGKFSVDGIADWGKDVTETIGTNPKGTEEIDDDDVFIDDSDMPSPSMRWMPLSKLQFALIGGEDGEIVAYNNVNSSNDLTVVMRGCFGTSVGKDGTAVWGKGETIQPLCVIAGAPTYKSFQHSLIDAKDLIAGDIKLSFKDTPFYDSSKSGVNPVDAFLMLMTSTGGGTNYDSGGGATNYDLLPENYGLGLHYSRVDVDAFENFKQQVVSDEKRFHMYIAKDSCNLLQMIVSDIQSLYGGMIYATKDGKISIVEFRTLVPSDDYVVVPQNEIISFDSIGVQEVFNAIQIVYDKWPSKSETTVNAYDYRRKAVMGESPAPAIVSESLRGEGWGSTQRFNTAPMLRVQLQGMLQLLGSGAPIATMTLHQKHMDLSPGDYIKFSHTQPPQIIANQRGFSSQLAMVLETEPQGNDSEIKVRAILMKEIKSALWAPSAQISAKASDSDFTIAASTFSDNDRIENYWGADFEGGCEIWIWDSEMETYHARTTTSTSEIPSSGRVVISLSSTNAEIGNRITWADWDTVKASINSAQIARLQTDEWYGYFADTSHTLGSSNFPARVYL